jgi:hypothetical protein
MEIFGVISQAKTLISTPAFDAHPGCFARPELGVPSNPEFC